MTRPIALIEGHLAFPPIAPFSDLPPPFGVRRVRKKQHPSTTTAFARAGRIPPGTRHVFICPRPKRTPDYRWFDAALEEARRYADIDRRQFRSTGKDRLLGGVIFIGCSIALCWLLVTCSIRDDASRDRNTVAVAQATMAPHTTQTAMKAPQSESITTVQAEPAVAQPKQSLAIQTEQPASTHANVVAVPSVKTDRLLVVPAPSQTSAARPLEARESLQVKAPNLMRPSVAEASTARQFASPTLATAKPTLKPANVMQPSFEEAPWLYANEMDALSPQRPRRANLSGNEDRPVSITNRRVTDDSASFSR